MALQSASLNVVCERSSWVRTLSPPSAKCARPLSRRRSHVGGAERSVCSSSAYGRLSVRRLSTGRRDPSAIGPGSILAAESQGSRVSALT